MGSFFLVLAAASSTATLSASMTRDISPPEAISCSGFSGSPGLVAMRYSTSSQPCAVHCGSSSLMTGNGDFEADFHGERVDLCLGELGEFCAGAFALRREGFGGLLVSFGSFARVSRARVLRISSRSSTSASLRATSSPKAMTSATVLPYLRLRRSSRARRSSISARRSGEALMPSA